MNENKNDYVMRREKRKRGVERLYSTFFHQLISIHNFSSGLKAFWFEKRKTKKNILVKFFLN